VSRRALAAVRRALAPSLALVALAVVTVAGLVARPEAPPTASPVDHVLVVGIAGLRWADVDRETTPHLWRLADHGAIGSLSVRSAARPTCAADGWLTLGAGNFATDNGRPAGAPCAPLAVTIETSDAAGAHLPEQEALVRANRWQHPWGAVPGALAGAVQCTSAVGPGAAVAGARTYGRVDRYVPHLPDQDALADLLRRCELGLVDLGEVSGDGAARRATLARVDAELAVVLAARPPEALLLVAGVADTADGPRLHVVVGDGPGLPRGFLTSHTTRRTGYVQLVDLAPTVLAALGRPLPQVPLAGSPVGSVEARDDQFDGDLRRMEAADREAGQAQPLRGWFLAGLAAAQLALLASVVPLLLGRGWLPRRGAVSSRPQGRRGSWQSRDGRPDTGGGWPALAPVLLVAVAMAVPAALVAGGLPWWREGPTGLVFAGLCLALVGGAAALLTRPAILGRPLAMLGTGCGLAGLAVAADLLSGSRLQLNGVLGYSALAGDRYAGLGAIGAGLVIAATLVGAGCAAQQATRRWRPVVVVAIGAVGVLLVGNTYLGADVGTAVALTAGVGLAAALCTGGWLTFRRLGRATAAGSAVIGTVALLELRRPADQRSGLGRMLTELAEGTAGFGLKRVSLANWESFTDSPTTLLALGSGVFLWLALLRPAGGLKRLFGVHPALRAGMAGTALAVVLAGVLTGAALTVAAGAAAVTLPLATVAALRVRQQEAATRPSAAAAAVSGHQLLW
jgi:hypothetical protein